MKEGKEGGWEETHSGERTGQGEKQERNSREGKELGSWGNQMT